MINNLREISIDNFIYLVSALKYDGYRFVTCSCADNRDGSFDLYYHFDKELQLINVKFLVTSQTEIPSITNLYLCAFLVENEIKELYGLNITNIAIDYKGRMFLTADAPFEPMTYGANITIEKREGK